MVSIREATIVELSAFVKMEQAEDTAEYITAYDLETHQIKFQDPDIVYLSILHEAQLAGFIILVLEADAMSVEFRRIVVSKRGSGVGQAAIKAMEAYCRNQLKRQRVWLDVFDFNQRGRHIYEKQGYTYFKREDYKGQLLLFYEKLL
ncbi:MAG: GNAT family N-acetyltransferase [Chloroflexota bacterium]